MNFRAVGLIKQLFPDARIIHIRRNPLDTCFSIYRRNFSKEWAFSNSLYDLGQFYALYVQYMAYWEKIFPGEILTIQYSGLIAEFENDVHRIIEYCGLDWDENCLKPEQVKRNVITFSSVQVRQRVTNSYSGQAESFHQFLEPLRRELLRANIDLNSGALLSAP
jgi:Sulfotransferase family